jgi:Sodium:neurotransmitter symporter family
MQVLTENLLGLDLPWGSCNNYWNTAKCVNPYERDQLTCWDHFNGTATNNLCKVGALNITRNEMSDPVKEFWECVSIIIIKIIISFCKIAIFTNKIQIIMFCVE